MPVVSSITVIEPRPSEPGASHIPPAAVTRTISVILGLVSAIRSRTVSIIVACRIATVMVVPGWKRARTLTLRCETVNSQKPAA